MRSKKAQTHLKRARELAVKERRDRKQAKRQARALARRSHGDEGEPIDGSVDGDDAAVLDRAAWNTP